MSDSVENRRKPHNGKVVAMLIVGVLVLGGVGAYIWYHVYCKDEDQKVHANKDSRTDKSAILFPYGKDAATVSAQVGTTTALESKKPWSPPNDVGRAIVKARKLWSCDELDRMDVFSASDLTHMIQETDDRSNLIVRPCASEHHIHEKAACVDKSSVIIIMAYQESACPSSIASAPLFASAATHIARKRATVGCDRPNVRLGVVDYHDIPVYVSNHLPKQTPAFFMYDPKIGTVKVADFPDLAQLQEQIVALYDRGCTM